VNGKETDKDGFSLIGCTFWVFAWRIWGKAWVSRHDSLCSRRDSSRMNYVYKSTATLPQLAG